MRPGLLNLRSTFLTEALSSAHSWSHSADAGVDCSTAKSLLCLRDPSLCPDSGTLSASHVDPPVEAMILERGTDISDKVSLPSASY